MYPPLNIEVQWEIRDGLIVVLSHGNFQVKFTLLKALCIHCSVFLSPLCASNFFGRTMHLVILNPKPFVLFIFTVVLMIVMEIFVV